MSIIAHVQDRIFTIRGILIVGAALDDYRTMMMPVNGTCDDDRIVTAVMAVTPGALAIVIEGDGAVTAMMQAVALVIDDDCRPVVIVMPVMCPDHDIGLRRRGDGGRGDTECQSSKKHCFHCSIPQS
ncbi:hypothetical protein LCM4577_22305 [Mesorhizobium sp. LCM 4577]|nr:hypothetical protein LCM4577_22305 [Mesorhizobium sp. LCM 4577]